MEEIKNKKKLNDFLKTNTQYQLSVGIENGIHFLYYASMRGAIKIKISDLVYQVLKFHINE